jgi:hypothetical protein
MTLIFVVPVCDHDRLLNHGRPPHITLFSTLSHIYLRYEMI